MTKLEIELRLVHIGVDIREILMAGGLANDIMSLLDEEENLNALLLVRVEHYKKMVATKALRRQGRTIIKKVYMCACGNARSDRYAQRCLSCHRKEQAQLKAASQAAVEIYRKAGGKLTRRVSKKNDLLDQKGILYQGGAPGTGKRS